MKVGKSGSLVLGLATFISSQNLKAQEQGVPPTVQESAASFESKKALQNTRLRELASLPEARASEIAGGLTEISKFYAENNDDWQILIDIIIDNKGELIKIFQGSLKLLASGDSQKQKIGADNLSALKELSPNDGLYTIRVVLEAKKHSDLFFSKAMQRPASDAIATEALVRSGFIILLLAQDRDNDPINFAKGLKIQIDNVLNSKQESKKDIQERQKILGATIEQFVNGRNFYNYAPGMSHENCRKILQTLIPAYKKLIERYALEPKYIKNALNTFISFKNIVPNKLLGLDKNINETVQKDLLSFLDTTLESINKLPNSENKSVLKKQAFTIPREYNGYHDSDKVTPVIELLSKRLCNKQKVYTEDLFYFRDSVFSVNPFNGDRHLAWAPYTVLKFASDNADYFAASVEQAIKDAERLESSEEKIEARNNLVEINIFFQNVSYLSYDYQELRSKVDTWSKNHVEEPTLKSFLSSIHKERVTVELVSNRYERNIDSKSWRKLNELLNELISKRPVFSKNLEDIVKKRLEIDKDPYLREMDFETLSAAVPSSVVISILREGIINEESPESLRGIGKAIAMGLISGQKNGDKYSPEDLLQRGRVGFTESDEKKNLSEFQSFFVDIIRIIDGNSDLHKKLLPNCSFRPSKNGKIDPKELNALMQLRRNAFLALAYSVAYSASYYTHPSPSYKEAVIEFLERRLERLGSIEKIGETWGDEIASLIEIYRTMKTTREDEKVYLDEKIKFLKGKIFDGYEEKHIVEDKQELYKIPPLFKRLEEGLFVELKQSKRIFKDTLEPEEERTLKDSDEYQEIKRQINRSKHQLAKRMLEHAPDRSMEFYRNCLNGMGYGGSQLVDILRTVFKIN